LQWCKDKLKLYPNSQNDIEKLLIELGDKCVNLGTIVTNLQEPRSGNTRQTIQGPTLRADFKKHREHLKKEKSIRKAIQLLLSELKPVLWEYEECVDVNRKAENLIEALRDFHPNREEYIDLLLIQTCSNELSEETGLFFTTLASSFSKKAASKLRLPIDPFRKTKERNFQDTLVLCPPEKIREWIKEKRELKSSTHNVWSIPMRSVVQELTSAGFSDNSAYETTAELFMLQYPEIFTDDLEFVKDRVKQHCKYEKRRDN